MKKSISFLLALFLFFSLPGLAFAEESSKEFDSALVDLVVEALEGADYAPEDTQKTRALFAATLLVTVGGQDDDVNRLFCMEDLQEGVLGKINLDNKGGVSYILSVTSLDNDHTLTILYSPSYPYSLTNWYSLVAIPVNVGYKSFMIENFYKSYTDSYWTFELDEIQDAAEVLDSLAEAVD